MIGAHLASGRDVVMPQMVARSSEIERFRSAATAAGATYTQVMLVDERDAAIARFHRRTGEGPLLDHVRDVVARDGGDRFLGMLHDGLMTLSRRDGVVVVRSVEGDPDGTYRRVLGPSASAATTARARRSADARARGQRSGAPGQVWGGAPKARLRRLASVSRPIARRGGRPRWRPRAGSRPRRSAARHGARPRSGWPPSGRGRPRRRPRPAARGRRRGRRRASAAGRGGRGGRRTPSGTGPRSRGRSPPRAGRPPRRRCRRRRARRPASPAAPRAGSSAGPRSVPARRPARPGPAPARAGRGGGHARHHAGQGAAARGHRGRHVVGGQPAPRDARQLGQRLLGAARHARRRSCSGRVRSVDLGRCRAAAARGPGAWPAPGPVAAAQPRVTAAGPLELVERERARPRSAAATQTLVALAGRLAPRRPPASASARAGRSRSAAARPTRRARPARRRRCGDPRPAP